MAALAVSTQHFKGFDVHTWTAVLSTSTCDAVEISGLIGSVYIGGVFDSATVVLKGSLNGTNYVVMTDPQGTAISKTAEGLEAFEESVRYVQPTHSGGSGSQSVNVVVFVRKP